MGFEYPQIEQVGPPGDICCMSATALVAAIGRGDLTALDAVEAHIARIERVNPALNAVVVKRYDAARDEARSADARRARGENLPPLHGLPITIKECLDLSGTASTFGLPRLTSTIARQDEEHVARLRRAGAIVLGKTNAGQLLLMLETSNPVYGRTNNPWNLARTAGGSSGGEGAIIAAAGSPLGFGTDIGGSCRVPAAFCGIAGFKPTQGRADDLGRASVPVGQRAIASQIGVMARHVEDLALGLTNVIDRSGPIVPLSDFRAIDVKALRIGCYVDDGILAPSPAVGRAVKDAADVLRRAGATVTDWTPPQLTLAFDLYLGLLSADRGRWIADLTRRQPIDPRLRAVSFLTRRSRGIIRPMAAALRVLGQSGLAANIRMFGADDTHHYWSLVERLVDYRRAFLAALDAAAQGPLDAILYPAAALPAFVHGATADLAIAGSYSVLANVLGYPAGTVFVTRVRREEETGRRRTRDAVQKAACQTEKHSAGLPVGVQVMARPWREDVTLAALHAIEAGRQ